MSEETRPTRVELAAIGLSKAVAMAAAEVSSDDHRDQLGSVIATLATALGEVWEEAIVAELSTLEEAEAALDNHHKHLLERVRRAATITECTGPTP